MHGYIFLYDKLQRYFSLLPVEWFHGITRVLYLLNGGKGLNGGELCQFFTGCNSRSTDVLGSTGKFSRHV